MKKIQLYIIIVVLIISVLIVADYLNAKYNATRPLIAIKSVKDNEQMIIYYGIFFKTYQCTAEENNYTTLSYFEKEILKLFVQNPSKSNLKTDILLPQKM